MFDTTGPRKYNKCIPGNCVTICDIKTAYMAMELECQFMFFIGLLILMLQNEYLFIVRGVICTNQRLYHENYIVVEVSNIKQ